MSRRTADEPSWEDDSWDDESEWDDDEPSLEDLEELGPGDETPTVPCPYCKRPLPEDVPRCPYCERYASSEDAPPPGRKPWWIIIGALLVFYIIYRWIVK
jgi:hypothetical protein